MGLFDLFKKKNDSSKNKENSFFDGLPNSYKKFLDENPNGCEQPFNEYKDEEPDFEGRYWDLMGKEELLVSWEMKGVDTARNFECLRLYVSLQKEHGQKEYTTSNVGQIPLERIESGFVIGHENGDYLYLDSDDNYSVWIYYHDGGDVLRISDSFEEFIQN